MPETVVAIGEILWDVFPDHERLGGATFNFSAHLSRLGEHVVFVSAVGRDALGDRALDRARELGIDTRWLKRVDHATGIGNVSLDASGKPTFDLQRPAAYDMLVLDDSELCNIARLQPSWIYFGTLHQIVPAIHQLVERLIAAMPDAMRFYDVNLRPDCYTASLIDTLLRTAHVVKLSDDEAEVLGPMFGVAADSLQTFCERLAKRFTLRAVCVTRGPRGAVMWRDGNYAESPGVPVHVVDTVGAGDAFAAALLHGLGGGWPMQRILDFANRLGALVASSPGAIP